MFRATVTYRSFLARLENLARGLRDDERGVSGIVMAIAAVVLLGFAGLAIDVITWEVAQRNMQGAADQAALAAATAYRNAGLTGALGSASTAQDAAYATALANGYPISTMTVAPFNNGTTCTNNGCLKVTLTQAQPRYFTGLFLTSDVTVSVSAVGTCSGCGNGTFVNVNNGGNPCVMALDSSGKGVISDTGGATLSLNKCDLYNNSPQTDATVLSNNAAVEGCSATNPCGSRAFLSQPNNPGNFDVPVITNASPAPDPYAGLTAPTVDTSCSHLHSYQNPLNHNEYLAVPSGTYCAQDFQNLSQSVVNFLPGSTIRVTGGLSLQNGNTLNGTGVLLYVQSNGSPSQASNINASTVLNLTAPTSGPYSGVAMWFDGTSPLSYAGQNGTGFSGAIYAPSTDVSYSGGSGGGSTCTRLVAASVTLSGSSTVTFDNSGCPAFASPVQAASGVTGSTAYNGSPMLIE